MGLKEKLLALSLVGLLPIPAAVANHTCSGFVKNISLDAQGTIFAEQIGTLAWPKLCSINSKVGNFEPAACKVLYANLIYAHSQNRSVTLWFNDDSLSCTNKVAWEFPLGFYFFRIND